jgi:hypothetical protein
MLRRQLLHPSAIHGLLGLPDGPRHITLLSLGTLLLSYNFLRRNLFSPILPHLKSENGITTSFFWHPLQNPLVSTDVNTEQTGIAP